MLYVTTVSVHPSEEWSKELILAIHSTYVFYLLFILGVTLLIHIAKLDVKLLLECLIFFSYVETFT
jgi:hypothetical protein